jgi:hypothetical protein
MDKRMTRGCIYYTDFRADAKILEVCQKQLLCGFNGEIISVTLDKPLNLGRNIVIQNEKRGYPTMVKQILTGLKNSTADYVFYTESDVLYHPSHFNFTPERDDIYYYNTNNYRWDYPKNRLINYDELTSLSMMCCNRELAIRHYEKRMGYIEKHLEEFQTREPRKSRQWGYEPGLKKRRRGGITDEGSVLWKSEYPNIDIRHKLTFSPPKLHLNDFKHPPTNFIEVTMDEIPGWDLKGLFNANT